MNRICRPIQTYRWTGSGQRAILRLMSLYPVSLSCQRVDPTRNLSRYYALAIEPTLFGETAVMRRWDRIRSRGGEKSSVFATEPEAAIDFLAIARRKRPKATHPVRSEEKLWKSGISRP